MKRACPSILLVRLGIGLGFFALVGSARQVGDVASGAALPSEDVDAPFGQSVTMLSDGRWLLLGGEGPGGPLNTGAVGDGETGETIALGAVLEHARAWHSATVLPDGSVLIVGGLGQDGQLLELAERLDVLSQVDGHGLHRDTIRSGLTPRAFHTATLLTDGRVLIAGGVAADGLAPRDIQLWDPKTNDVETFPGVLTTARYRHTARLLSDGNVQIWGGFDAHGNPLSDGDVIASRGRESSRTDALVAMPLADPPHVAGAVPSNGARNVPTDTIVGVRFSKPVRVDTVSDLTVHIARQHRPIGATVIAAEQGMLAFVTPHAPLQDGTRYTVTIHGVSDEQGLPLPTTRLHFRTARLGGGSGDSTASRSTGTPPVSHAPSGEREGRGSGNRDSSDALEETHPDGSRWQSLPPLKAKPGVTALAGQVLRLNGEPLAAVTLRIGQRRTRTDDTGRFLLTAIPGGRQELLIDGRTASRPGTIYGLFEVGVMLVAGRTTVLPYTSWMPAIDTAHAVAIPSQTSTEVVVTTPNIPGLELHIPPHTTIRDEEGHAVREVSITPIPVDRPPFPLAKGVKVPVYFTIQPGSAYVENDGLGARLIYPNYTYAPAGWNFNFWHYDPGGRDWYVYGAGVVSSDARQVIPDPGVAIYEFTGAMISGGSVYTPPANGPHDCAEDGEPVNLGTGLFVTRSTDLALPGPMPIVLTRIYRPNDTRSRPFGVGSSHSLALYLWSATTTCSPITCNCTSTTYDQVDLVLSDGDRVHFVRTSPGTDVDTAVFEHRPPDATCPSCVATPSRFYGSVINRTSRGWDLELKDGSVYHFGSDSGSVVGSIRDRFGNELTFTYKPRDASTSCEADITRVADQYGRYIDFLYDGTTGRIRTATDSAGRQVLYDYDTSGRLTDVTDAAGGVTKYAYDQTTLTISDPRRNAECPLPPAPCNRPQSLTVGYWPTGTAKAGLVQSQTLADGASTYQFDYDIAGGKITKAKVTNPLGDQREVTFNTDGYTTSDTKGLYTSGGVTNTSQARTITYNRNWMPGTNKISSIIEPLSATASRTAAFDYWPSGKLKTVSRSASGSPTAIWSFEYEPTYNQLSKITDPTGKVIALGYDAKANPTILADPEDATHYTTLTYNTRGQMTSATDAAGNVTTVDYDGRGDLVSITEADGTSAAAKTTRFIDLAGRLRSLTDPLGRRTRYDYDERDRLRFVTDALGGVTEFRYDANGNLKEVIDPRQQGTGKSTLYEYDFLNRLTKRTDAADVPHFELFAYDGMGNATSFQDRNGDVTTFAYDHLGRLAFTGFGATGTPPSINYDSSIIVLYDKGNRATQLLDSESATISRGYDPRDNLACESTSPACVCTFPTPSCAGSQAGVISSTFDEADRKTTLTVGGQGTLRYCYDAAGRLTGIIGGNDCGNPTPTAYVALGYDEAGRRKTLTLTDPNALMPNGVTIRYGYGPASRVSSIQYTKTSDGSVIGAVTYSYDAAGNRITEGGSWGRTGLPAEVASTVYDYANRLKQWDSRNLAYNNSGNLTDDGAHNYSWNKRNQLISVNTFPTTAFQYDALGRRIEKKVPAVPTGSATTGYRYDGLNPVQELASVNGAVVANLLTGLELDEYFARTDINGGIQSMFLSNALTSTVALVDNAGVVQTEYTYEPFGATVASSSSPNSLQFTGRESDLAELYYYRARYYSPTWGRFISEDPIGFDGGPNLYSYAGANPLSWIDPDGRDAVYISFRGYPVETGHGTLPLGHAGCVAIDPKTGQTDYFEYGRYDSDFGQVKERNVPDVIIGENGKPTSESLNNLYRVLSKHYGKGCAVDAEYYPDADYAKVGEFARTRMRDSKRAPYSWNPLHPNHCKTFAREAICAGRR